MMNLAFSRKIPLKMVKGVTQNLKYSYFSTPDVSKQTPGQISRSSKSNYKKFEVQI